MKRLKNITILLCFLSLLAFISCSAEDKTGVANNPPENDTEITGGETESGGTGSSSGSGSETGGSGTGGSGSGDSGTETGGGSGTGTGGSGSGSGSGEGGTRTLSYYAGNWFCISEERGEVNFFTINADGSLIMKSLNDGSETPFPSTSITKNSDTSYTQHDAEKNAKMHFNFTSDTEGTITFEDVGSGSMSDIPVTKK